MLAFSPFFLLSRHIHRTPLHNHSSENQAPGYGWNIPHPAATARPLAYPEATMDAQRRRKKSDATPDYLALRQRLNKTGPLANNHANATKTNIQNELKKRIR